MESEGGNENRQKRLAYRLLQAEFVVSRSRYLPRVKFQQAGRVKLY